MDVFTEEELERMENIFIESIHEELKGMSKDNKLDLLDMLIDSLDSMRGELIF